MWQPMVLDKWYLDAVFPDGTAWFGYRARLRFWRWPVIAWSSGCRMSADGQVGAAARWGNWPEPNGAGGRWRWQAPDGFDGLWKGGSESAAVSLAAENQLQVRWHCLAPRAAVAVTLDGETRNGAVGYLEHLRVESAARALPFRRLWWGHAHAGESSLVWIRWAEGRDLCVLLEDGVRVEGNVVPLAEGGVRVKTARGEWETGRGRVLCDRDVRRSFPRWLVLLARGMAPARELKISGPVRLRAGADQLTGAGIWEEVRWT